MASGLLISGHMYAFRCRATAGNPNLEYWLRGDIYNKIAILAENVIFASLWVARPSPIDHNQTTLQLITESDQLFLDARTADKTVGLAETPFPPFIGTQWDTETEGPGGYRCYIRFDKQGTKYYLDGRTEDLSVGLTTATSATNPNLSGTAWEVHDVSLLLSPALKAKSKALADG